MLIARALLDELIAHAREDPKIECCGVVAVEPSSEGAAEVATRVYRATNIHASALKFEIDPMEQYRLTNEIEDEGWEIGAIYHSHVRSPPYPSQTDINFAANWPGVEWIIVGLAAGRGAGGPLLPDRGRQGPRGADRRGGKMKEKPLICPDCGVDYPRSERFCSACEMPLVYLPGSEREASERQRKARKIKPQYAEGRLVKVAYANNQPEAELIEALLLEEGIPSMTRRSGRLRRAGLPGGRPARRAGSRVGSRGCPRSAGAPGPSRGRG